MSLSHIALSSGRSIELTELRMSSTYGGMLEGYPFTVVWFQTVLDVPSGEDAGVALRGIRWEELAQDYEL